MPGPTESRTRDLVTRRPAATAAVLYLLLAIVMFAPGLAPGRTLSASDYLWTATPWDSSRPAGVPLLGSNREMVDSATLFEPTLETTRASLPDVPLWNPYILSGRPYLGDSQAAVLSPFSVPAYVLPVRKAPAVMAMLKLFVAAMGAFLLARTLGLRFAGSLLTGLVFGFSLWSVTWVSWTTMGVWAFLPWLCLFSERCVRRPEPLAFAGLAAVTGLQFLAGHPSSSFQVLTVVALLWTGRTLADRSLRDGLARRLLVLGGALLAGAALAAVMLIPFGELLSRSGDVDARRAIAESLHQPARFLLGIFLHDYWGHGRSAVELSAKLEEHAYYVAALPLMLAAAALVVRPRSERLAVAITAVVTLAIAVGMPPLYDLVLELPGFSAAHNGRLAVVAILCVALLAGWGLDDLMIEPARRAGTVIALAVALFTLPVAIVVAAGDLDLDALSPALKVAWGFATATPELASDVAGGLEAVVRLASVLEWLLVAAAAVVLVVLRLRGRLSATAFAVLALLLVAGDLARAGLGYNPAIPVTHAEQPATGAIRYLQERLPARFAGLEPRAEIAFAPPLPPDVSMRYGLYDARGYAIPYEERYGAFWRRAIAPDGNCYYLFCTLTADDRPQSLRALALLGVTDLLQNRGDPPLRGFTPAYRGGDARVYRNPAALPRAFVVDRQVVTAGGQPALEAVTDAAFDPRAAAVTERAIEGVPAGVSSSVSSGTASVADYGSEKVVVEARSEEGGLLVLTDPWFPGWKATVDGKDAEVHRVDYLLRGVALPAGKHRVEFRYEPGSVRAGLAISAVALIGVAGIAGVGLRRRRRL